MQYETEKDMRWALLSTGLVARQDTRINQKHFFFLGERMGVGGGEFKLCASNCFCLNVCELLALLEVTERLMVSVESRV